MLPLTSFCQKIDFSDENHIPDNRFLNVRVTAVDTLKADSMYNAIRPFLLEQYNLGFEKVKKCQDLILMRGKKVTTNEDLHFLQIAYDNAITYYPELRKFKTNKPINAFYAIPLYGFAVGAVANMGRDGQAHEKYDKNVKKGKVTEDVVKYLSCYNEYLKDSLKRIEESINSGWIGNIAPENLPRKKIIKQMNNPYYRGLWYNDADTLDMIERYQQTHGWEFLYTNKRKQERDSYPTKVEYYVYAAAPKYKVTYSENGINEVYNAAGQLIFVPRLTRNKTFEFKEIQRLVYLKDYRNNKYNIKSKSAHTQNYLYLFLERENGFEESVTETFGAALGTAFVGGLFGPFSSVSRKANMKGLKQVSKYTDNDGSNFIDQLRKDHDDEFGYIYSIKRLSNTSFQVLYLNSKSLLPSYCATITYRTGNKPFTCDYSAKFVKIPSNISEIIKK